MVAAVKFQESLCYTNWRRDARCPSVYTVLKVTVEPGVHSLAEINTQAIKRLNTDIELYRYLIGKKYGLRRRPAYRSLRETGKPAYVASSYSTV